MGDDITDERINKAVYDLALFVSTRVLSLTADLGVPSPQGLGATVMQIIVCASRHPEWAQWFRLVEEQGDDPDDLQAAMDRHNADMAIMEAVPAG